MSYTSINFKTKKALVEAVRSGKRVTVWEPGPFGSNLDNGDVYLEGPHYPEPHRWYARAVVRDGAIVRVK